ncbi:anthranilate phosphoribosyltransferase [Ruania suaedae]|uniref:anthranilate phosphoribosyltransferase n=1 Tax=Ruania suaedae TaxID=2897774 RepID=UPI001E52F077|nr:anthranilate phosphoribosyltransferase [Ruania suaedae]UFU01639.1 anthranilate phosphoribosyltransferase [Ruania suaedae]
MRVPAPGPTWPDLITSVIAGEDLSAAETSWVMDQVMSGASEPVALGGLLVALRAKGETVAEVTGLAEAMLRHALPVSIDDDAVDIVGTGGDRHRSVNISTMAALVVAGAGVRVVKHGNRAASSSSGSADVLEALGVRLDLDPRAVERVAARAGITFLFARVFHPGFRHAAAARSGLGVATAFNVLGPLTNPARPRAGAIGVGDLRMAPIMAGVLAQRGTSALVFRSEDGLDELATTAPARVWEAAGCEVREHVIDATREFGMARATLADLRGGDAAVNAQVARDLLAGAPGAVRDAVLLNAAAGLVAHGGSPGMGEGSLLERFAAGIEAARRSIDEGAAARALAGWVQASHDD